MSSDTPRKPSPRCEHGALIGYCEECNYNEAGFARQRIPELEAELAAANKRLEEVKELLRVAKCPNCDGCGFIVHETGGCDPDGENDTRECVHEQCQWCYERAAIDGKEGK